MTPHSVSVIVANYNYGRFLGEAIESALGQTVAPLEVIVVDDGSTDDSIAVAQRYDVHVIEHPNAGVAYTRNRGARAARGDSIVFLDADDMLEPTYIERCLEVRGDEAYAYTQTMKFGTEVGLLPSRPFNGRELFEHNFVPVTTLLRRRIFLESGGFDPSWPAHEDYELWARLFSLGHRGAYVPEPLLRYRFHGRSRNTMTQEQQDALHMRLVLRYPYCARHWIARNKWVTIRAALRGR